jgi:oligopeptide transport system substrate-binding protein
VPRHILAAHGEDWTEVDKIVTNGPFRLERWHREERLVLARNETYHGRFQGNVQKVELILLGELWSTADRDARSLALYKADTLDVVSLWETQVDLVRQQYPAEHRSIPTFWLAYVALNPAQPPFKDLRVRQAFALAIDQERFVNEVWKGLFTPAHGGFIPPGMPGHSEGIGLLYDPTQARRLLAEAGYPEGHHFPRLKGLGGTKAEIENLQRQWRENLGVDVEWEVLDFTTVLERLDTELPSLYVMGYAVDYPDPDNLLRIFFQQMYRFKWRNEAYERLVEEAKRLTDQNKRLNLYRQADLILVEDVPLVPLIHVREHFLVKPWVRKYIESPTQRMFWKDVIIEPHP